MLHTFVLSRFQPPTNPVQKVHCGTFVLCGLHFHCWAERGAKLRRLRTCMKSHLSDRCGKSDPSCWRRNPLVLFICGICSLYCKYYHFEFEFPLQNIFSVTRNSIIYSNWEKKFKPSPLFTDLKNFFCTFSTSCCTTQSGNCYGDLTVLRCVEWTCCFL